MKENPNTINYHMNFPAPPAAQAAKIERAFVDHALSCGAVRAFVTPEGDEWHCVAEFEDENAFSAMYEAYEAHGFAPTTGYCRNEDGAVTEVEIVQTQSDSIF